MNAKLINYKVPSIDRVICFIFCCWILVDSINGFAITNGIGFPISQIVKFGLFLLVLLRTTTSGPSVLATLFLVPYVILVSINTITVGASVGSTLILLMKPVTTFYFFLYFVFLAKKKPVFFLYQFRKIIIWSALFVVGNIVLGLLGFGNFAYESDNEDTAFGIKGFIYAANEMSGVLSVLVPISLLLIHQSYNRIVYFISCIAILLIVYCMGTKSAILIAVISSFCVTYILGKKRERRLVLLFAIIIAVLVVTYFAYIFYSDVAIMQRFRFFYERNGLWSAILSGRWEQWTERSAPFFKMDFVSKLLGWGNQDIICELDPFDALLNFGYIGCTVNVFFLIYLFIYPRVRRDKDGYDSVMVLVNTLLFFISILSGHIFFSSMSGMLISLSNAMLYINYKGINQHSYYK